jgi:microcystin degradation protein MlrC
VKAYYGLFSTETNTFSAVPTGLAAFDRSHPPELAAHWEQRLAPFRKRAIETLGGFHADASPSAPITSNAYHVLRDELLQSVREALPLTFVCLILHGAMVAEDCDDCEGDILLRIRELVGSETLIGAALDPHCHLTQQMVANSDLLIAYKEYPHTDADERADEVVSKLLELYDRKQKPSVAVYDCRTIAIYQTDSEPMRSFVDGLLAREGRDGIFSISVAHGFPWGDVADIGTKVLVYADDAENAVTTARELGEWLIAHRGQTYSKAIPVDEAISRGLQAHGLAIIADIADNTGGGAGGDSTFVLRALLERSVSDVVLGALWDPVAVAFAMASGEGSTIRLRIGGKVSAASGEPLDVQGTVKRLARKYESAGLTSVARQYGDIAVIELPNNVDVVLNTERIQVITPAFFVDLGIDLAQKQIAVVKSMHHFNMGFGPIAADVIYASSDGALSQAWAEIPYRHIKRPMWPLDPVAEGHLI